MRDEGNETLGGKRGAQYDTKDCGEEGEQASELEERKGIVKAMEKGSRDEIETGRIRKGNGRMKGIQKKRKRRENLDAGMKYTNNCTCT